MRFTTKTEYGLICLMYIARHYPQKKIITTHELIKNERFPKSFIEKIFQSLNRAGVVQAYRGKYGGYSLAKDPGDITLKQIIEALEGSTFDVYCDAPNRDQIVCNHLCMCGMKPVWKKTKELIDNFYETITLKTLSTNEAALASIALVT